VAELQVKLSLGEQERRERKYIANIESYDHYLKGLEFLRHHDWRQTLEARKRFEKAIELDPKFPDAYALLARIYWLEWVEGRSRDPQILRKAYIIAQKALALDDGLPLAYVVIGAIHLWRRQHSQAIAAGKKAVQLDPNDAQSYAVLGDILSYSGEPQEGVQLIKKAMRLDPHYPPIYDFFLGHAYYAAGRYQDSITASQKSVKALPSFWSPHAVLCAAYGELGKPKEAREAAAMVLKLNPQATLAHLKQALPYKDPEIGQRVSDALREAGMPE
jgi:adenylate cyclase